MNLKLSMIAICLLLGSSSWAAGKAKCKAGYEKISCSEIKAAKRKSFCWKGDLKNDKKEKICKSKTKRKHKKHKGTKHS